MIMALNQILLLTYLHSPPGDNVGVSNHWAVSTRISLGHTASATVTVHTTNVPRC